MSLKIWIRRFLYGKNHLQTIFYSQKTYATQSLKNSNSYPYSQNFDHLKNKYELPGLFKDCYRNVHNEQLK